MKALKRERVDRTRGTGEQGGKQRAKMSRNRRKRRQILVVL